MGKAGKSAAKKKSVPVGDDESARGRLLSAATHLFCKNGINATGIDAIIEEAGTAKTTLYKLFGSKTNLVHAVLESEGRQWRDWFIASLEDGGGDAQTKLTRIFPALKRWFAEERFYGREIDGATVAAMDSRNPGVADTAGLAASSLFEPAKQKKPKRAAASAQLVAV